jgi:hypothetical protein
MVLSLNLKASLTRDALLITLIKFYAPQQVAGAKLIQTVPLLVRRFLIRLRIATAAFWMF